MHLPIIPAPEGNFLFTFDIIDSELKWKGNKNDSTVQHARLGRSYIYVCVLSNWTRISRASCRRNERQCNSAECNIVSKPVQAALHALWEDVGAVLWMSVCLLCVSRLLAIAQQHQHQPLNQYHTFSDRCSIECICSMRCVVRLWNTPCDSRIFTHNTIAVLNENSKITSIHQYTNIATHTQPIENNTVNTQTQPYNNRTHFSRAFNQNWMKRIRIWWLERESNQWLAESKDHSRFSRMPFFLLLFTHVRFVGSISPE